MTMTLEKPINGAKKGTNNNNMGHNRYTNALPDRPYAMRYAQCKALLDMGRTYEQIKLSTGLSDATISLIKKGEREVNDAWVNLCKRNESKMLTLLSNEVFSAVSSEDIKKASLLQKVTAGSIMLDKRELLDGKPTQNIGLANVVGSVQSELAKLKIMRESLDAEVVNETGEKGEIKPQITKEGKDTT